MGRRFLITGTGIGVGKTTIGCALAFAFRSRAMRVGVMKPVDTGCADVDGELHSLDTRALALAASLQLPPDIICPYRYRSQLAPPAAAELDHLQPPNLDHIARRFHEIAKQSDAVIVESAGGIATPIAWDADFADLATLLSLEVIVVIGIRPGWINDGVLTLKYAESRSLNIAGYILCHVEPSTSPHDETNENFTRLGNARYLGRMRFREPLSKAIVELLI
jgi:dethiobiotin synthetase